MTLPSTDRGLPPVIAITGDGLHLREWADDDIHAMAELFDDPQVDRWTPLAHPFDIPAATSYLALARRTRAAGVGIQLAITTDGHQPLGEILLFRRGENRQEVELAYAIGVRYRRQRLALRAVRLMTAYAYENMAAQRVILRIAGDNDASSGVARAVGFRLTDEAPAIRNREGRTITLRTWCHYRPGA